MGDRVKLGVRALSSSSVSTRVRVGNNAQSSNVQPGNAVLLDVLDEPELLSMIAGSLAVRDQLSLGGTCKLFALIVGENHQNTTFLSTTVEQSVEATRDAIAPTLKSPPSFGLMFANPGREGRKRKIKALVRSLPPAAHIVGGEVRTLVGTAPGGDVSVTHSAGFALSLGSFPEATVGSFALAHNAPPGVSLVEQLEEQGALTGDWKVIIVMASVYGSALGQVLNTLQERHPAAAILGGLATGNYLLHAHHHKVQTISRGCVGLMFGGNVPMQALVCSGTFTKAISSRLATARRQLVEEQKKELLGGLMFTCTARSERSDAAHFAKAFPSAPLVGMPCNGEIGPGGGVRSSFDTAAAASSNITEADVTQSGDVELHGFTAVFGLFAVPVRSRAAPLHYSDLEAAYKASRATEASARVAAAATAAAELPDEGDDADDDDDDEDEGEEEDDSDDYDDFDGGVGGEGFEFDEYEEDEDDEWDDDYDDDDDGDDGGGDAR